MEFTIESAGGVACRTTIAGHELRFDQPAEYGGQNLGPSPLDVMAASVGACAHYYAAAFLTARRLPTEGIVVKVHAEKAKEGRRRLGNIHIMVTVPADVPEAMLPRIEAAVLTCPAWGTLQVLPESTLTVERG
ncbi:hypothetical protein LBMAG42_07670 [Deltaproteobacteria bacterium]|nr:hypothetical protein LBMAG42_07670 [Deltaproteobacteria bacterium]